MAARVGSLAAAIQAGIGNVAAGSIFAVMTSLGATGAIAGIGTALGLGGIAAWFAGGWLVEWFKKRFGGKGRI